MTLLKDPPFPESVLAAGIKLLGLKLSKIGEVLRVHPNQLSNMLAGRALLHRNVITKLCEMLDIDFEEFKKRYCYHFNGEGNIPPRGFRLIDTKKLEAYEKAQREERG